MSIAQEGAGLALIKQASNAIREATDAMGPALDDGRSTSQKEVRRASQAQFDVHLKAARDVLRTLLSKSETESAGLRSALLAIEDVEGHMERAFSDKMDRPRNDARNQIAGLLSDADRELTNEIVRYGDEAAAMQKIAAGLAKQGLK